MTSSSPMMTAQWSSQPRSSTKSSQTPSNRKSSKPGSSTKSAPGFRFQASTRPTPIPKPATQPSAPASPTPKSKPHLTGASREITEPDALPHRRPSLPPDRVAPYADPARRIHHRLHRPRQRQLRQAADDGRPQVQ